MRQARHVKNSLRSYDSAGTCAKPPTETPKSLFSKPLISTANSTDNREALEFWDQCVEELFNPKKRHYTEEEPAMPIKKCNHSLYPNPSILPKGPTAADLEKELASKEDTSNEVHRIDSKHKRRTKLDALGSLWRQFYDDFLTSDKRSTDDVYHILAWSRE